MIGGHERRDRSGRYAVQERCEFCTKPIHGEQYSDEETCNSTGLGLLLCGRVRCCNKREALPLPERLKAYAAGREAAAKL